MDPEAILNRGIRNQIMLLLVLSVFSLYVWLSSVMFPQLERLSQKTELIFDDSFIKAVVYGVFMIISSAIVFLVYALCMDKAPPTWSATMITPATTPKPLQSSKGTNTTDDESMVDLSKYLGKGSGSSSPVVDM